ncbi:MAG: FecR domain-containing protein [Deltaproteobacteria bacterium]|nr:FecR domain-containing protein [Deltaproteobacteria bacterium]
MKRACGFLIAFIAVAALSSSTPIRAAELDTEAVELDREEEGFSAYSVARLKIFEGSAWVRLPDSGEWEEYSTNTPIPERARINVPEGSEAELQFHGGQFVLLTGGTDVDVRKFDEEGTAFRLRSGEIRFDLPADDFSPVSVAVPGGKANFSVPGRYWLDVRDDRETRLVVRSGEGAVTVNKGEFRVKAGEQALIGRDVRISAYSGKGDEGYAPPSPLSEEEKKAGVPPAAANELRDYGEWVHSDDYGWVWRPRVAPDWTPYYYGRWVWVSPYGWTWVSNEPWGWYPYHFGWWVADPFFGWIWCPFHSFVSVSFVFGHVHFVHFHRTAFFFPATVRFVRDGRFVRWLPLRPGERFVRSTFTRTDTRLARWDRPLDRGRVFVRAEGERGKRGWRDWTTAQRERTAAADRGRDVRVRLAPPRGEGPMRDDGSAVRKGMGTRPDRQERFRGREFRGREGRSPRGSLAPENRRGGGDRGVRTESARPPRSERSGRNFREGMPPARMSAPPPPTGPRHFTGERGFSRLGPGGSIRMESAGGLRGPAERFQTRGSVPGRGGGERFDSGGRGGHGFSGGGRR